MPSLITLKKKILDLKNKVARDSITPLSLGEILDEFLDSYTAACAEIEASAERAQAAEAAAAKAKADADQARADALQVYNLAQLKKPGQPAGIGRTLHRGIMPMNAVKGVYYVRYYNGASKTIKDDVRFALPRGYNNALNAPDGHVFGLPEFLVGRTLYVHAIHTAASAKIVAEELGGRPMDEFYEYEVIGRAIKIKYTQEFLDAAGGDDKFPFLFVVAPNFGNRLSSGGRVVQWIDRDGHYRESTLQSGDSYPELPAPEFSRISHVLRCTYTRSCGGLLFRRMRHFGKAGRAADSTGRFTPHDRNRHYCARLQYGRVAQSNVYYAQTFSRSRYKSRVVKISVGPVFEKNGGQVQSVCVLP